jgi:hypothetical protein
MPDEIRDNDEKIVNRALDQLMLHFDSAQVFVTRQDGDNTVGGSFGRGNWYARKGQVGEWLENGGAMHIGDDDSDVPG